MELPRSKRIAMATYVAASSLDTLTTAYRVQRHGASVEANPLISYAMALIGTHQALAAITIAEGATVLPLSAMNERIGYFSATQALYIGAAFHLFGATVNTLAELVDRL